MSKDGSCSDCGQGGGTEDAAAGFDFDPSAIVRGEVELDGPILVPSDGSEVQMPPEWSVPSARVGPALTPREEVPGSQWLTGAILSSPVDWPTAAPVASSARRTSVSASGVTALMTTEGLVVDTGFVEFTPQGAKGGEEEDEEKKPRQKDVGSDGGNWWDEEKGQIGGKTGDSDDFDEKGEFRRVRPGAKEGDPAKQVPEPPHVPIKTGDQLITVAAESCSKRFRWIWKRTRESTQKTTSAAGALTREAAFDGAWARMMAPEFRGSINLDNEFFKPDEDMKSENFRIACPAKCPCMKVDVLKKQASYVATIVISTTVVNSKTRYHAAIKITMTGVAIIEVLCLEKGEGGACPPDSKVKTS